MKFILTESADDWYYDSDDYDSYEREKDYDSLENYFGSEDNYMKEYLVYNFSHEDILDAFKDYCLSDGEQVVKDETVLITIQDKDGEYELDWDEVIDEVLDSEFISSQDVEIAKREYIENHYNELNTRRNEHEKEVHDQRYLQ